MPAKGKSTKRRTTARKRSPARANSAPPGDEMRATILTDALVLISLALALFSALAVYYPQFSSPAGPVAHDALHTSLGVGMYVAPAILLLVPLVVFRTRWHRMFLKAWAWAWSLTLLSSLVAGLIRDRDLGGLLGDSCAALGYDYLGWFYPVLVILVALVIIGRLAGRSMITLIARLFVRAAVETGEAVVDISHAVKEEAEELQIRRVAKRQERQARDQERAQRREEVLAAELEAADAPEGDSPLIREQLYAPESYEEDPSAPGTASGEPPTVHGLGEDRGETSDADNPTPAVKLLVDSPPPEDEFTAVVNAAGTELAGAGDEPATPEFPPQIEPDATADDEEPPATAANGQYLLFSSTQAGYELPPLSLLRDAPKAVSEEEHLSQRARIIERTLRSFNIDASCANTVVGPRVTRYELKIGPGINVSRIHGLADNLALELAVKAVRIEAPVPGLSAVGIEVPNAAPQLVTLKSILSSPLNQRANHPLTVGLGRDIAGHPIIANVAKMPHLLVAGATGSGKSVCLNALVISLLYRNAPDTLRFILIDPKRVEMTNYAGLPHLACPVVHDVHEAQSALKWAVAEMDRRYRLLEEARARNIAAYNELKDPGEQLPFIVVMVDELADLMMLAGPVIEKLVCRIAQLSRAVGIHLVIATQRPDVKVITGTIKANIPSRVAFAVVSHIDSRTILDGVGAEKLLGSGDMLFSPIGENVPLRVQGAFVSDDEIDRVVGWCRTQAPAAYDERITQYAKEEEAAAAGDGRDELFGDALEIVQSTGRASTSYLQRRLKIGYNRAARIMEELEQAGIVSPPDAQGNRKVL